MKRIALLAVTLLPFVASAEMYKWVDKKGVTQVSEMPPPDVPSTKVDVRPATGSAPPVQAGTQARQGTQPQPQPQFRTTKAGQKVREEPSLESTPKYNNCAESQRRLSLAQTDAKATPADKALARDVTLWEKNVKKYCD